MQLVPAPPRTRRAQRPKLTLTQRIEKVLTLSGWRGRGIDFTAGAIAVLGLAPFYVWIIALLAFGVLALRLDRRAQAEVNAAKLCRSSGFWFGMGYFVFGIFWIGSAFIARGPEYVPLMVPMVLGLCFVLSLFWMLAGHVYAKLRPNGLWAPFIFASLLSMAEIARGHVLTGFPWNLPGYVFKAGGAVSQSASLIGIYGLTFLTLLLSGLIAHSLSSRDKGAEKPAGLAVLVLLFSLFGFGFARLQLAKPLEFHKGVNLRIVQIPFDQSDKFDPKKSIDIVNQYLTQTAEPGLEDVTHLVWPEGAVNGLALENEPLIRAVSELFLSFDNSPPIWMTQSLRSETRPNLKGEIVEDYYNTSAAISFAPDGSAAIETLNDKSLLVPFGEYIPFGKWVENRGVSPLSTAMASISPAPKKLLASFPGLPRVSPQICYEIIFSAMTPRPRTSEPAQWILNQSNDGWYGKSSGPRQHANQAAYRAIEEGLPIVRSAGNGISGVIDPYGRWYVRAEPDARMALDTQLPKPISRPLFFGNHIWFLFLINFASCLVYTLRWGRLHGAGSL